MFVRLAAVIIKVLISGSIFNMKEKNIHWYPGHMKKAFNEIEARIKLVDVVVEIVDARAPISSKNPFLEELIKNKKRIIVFSKFDLVTKEELSPFLTYYENKGYMTLPFNVSSKQNITELKNAINLLGKEKREKEIKRGMKPQNIRVMVLGIPNVGKSSLINALVGRNSASKANKPGHTKAQQWVRIGNGLDLLDTPGVLPPHYEDQKIALHLALIGSLPDDILPLSFMCENLLNFLMNKHEEALKKRFKIETPFVSQQDVLEKIARTRGLLLKEGKLDIASSEKLILKEFKEGMIAKTIIDELC